MRKEILFALMMPLFLLPGCGGGQEEETLPLAGLNSAQMGAQIICHYDEEIRSYTLSCDWEPNTAEVTVQEPEEVAGLTAVWNGDELTLSYQDLVLDAGPMSGTDLSPAMVLPAMVDAIRSGYPIERGREDLGETPCMRVTYEVDEGQTLYSVWYTTENVPLRCEVERDGVLLFEVTVTDFSGVEEGAEEDEVRTETDLGGDRP